MSATLNSSDQVSLEYLSACPICKSRVQSRSWTHRDIQFDGPSPEFSFTLCGGCGVYYLSTRCPESVVSQFYRSSSYSPYFGGEELQQDAYPYSRTTWGPIVTACERYRVDSILSKLCDPFIMWPAGWYQKRQAAFVSCCYDGFGPGTRFLDYGCGTEAWLDQGRKSGWLTEGVDFNPEIVHSLRARGYDVHLPDLWMENDKSSTQYDLIRLNHVLEHLYDPLDVLQRLTERLSPRGILHIATPNPHSWVRWIMGDCWFPFEYPRHIVMFPPRVLERHLRNMGYTTIKILSSSVTKDFVRSLGSQMADRGTVTRAGIVSHRYDGWYSRVASWPALIAAWCGCSDQYTIIARRQGNTAHRRRQPEQGISPHQPEENALP